MDCEVLGFAPNPGSSGLQNGFEISFLKEQHVEDARQAAHNPGNVLGPSPTQIALRDESSHDMRNEWPDEDEGREESNGNPSRLIPKQIRESPSDHSQRARHKDASEESREQ